MKIIVFYIISVASAISFINRVEMNNWEFALLLTTILTGVLYGMALGESDKKESK